MPTWADEGIAMAPAPKASIIASPGLKSGEPDMIMTQRPDGTILLRSALSPAPYPAQLSDYLC